MAEYVVKGAEPNETVLHTQTPNGYEFWQWLLVREEIVRCRDCNDYRDPLRCVFFNIEVSPDGFCAWGERKVVD